MNRSACYLLAAFLLPLSAQIQPPGPSGVSLGHLHLHSGDAAAQAKFWVDVFGAVPTKVGDLVLYKLPGVFIAINAEKPTGGMEGSTVPLIGLRVRDLKSTLEKAKEAGATVVGTTVVGPDNIRIELTADPKLTAACEMEGIHLALPDTAEGEQWYLKTFGVVLGKLPGVQFTFSRASGTPAGTKGRALDHIGLEVRDLREFTKKLAASGQKVDLMYYKLPDSGVAIAFVTDPFGTYIELTEGLTRF